MERNNSDSCRKSSVASQEGGLGKVTATITKGRCFELEDSVGCERALEIPWSRTSGSKRWDRVPRVAVLLVVMLGTCSALPDKPIRRADQEGASDDRGDAAGTRR